MTPKEKAIELLWKFNPNGIHWDVEHIWIGTSKSPEFIKKGIAQSCKYPALIAVDEILDAIDWDYYEGSSHPELNYWRQVKKEIEAL